MSNLSRSQIVRKHVATTRNGVVAAQHKVAAEIGAAVLEAGGDAVDAAVATSFAIGVVEPWMSGPAGGGAMTIWREYQQQAQTIQFGMRSPSALDPANYPLSGEGRAGDLFPWAAVVDDLNVQGATAIAVPGTVAGMALAHQKYGALDWKELLMPAVGLARKGLLVDWYASLLIASTARELAKDADAAALFLDGGQWPKIAGWTALSSTRLDQSRMAETLLRLAEAGPRDFYEGDIAAALAADVEAKGGCISRDDLASYRARLTPTIDVSYRGGIVRAAEGMTAGPNLVECLATMDAAFVPGGRPDAVSFAQTARALSGTYKRRLLEMGDVEPPHAPSCTTHFSVVDKNGNMCAVTQTLLSIFGSRVVSPSTGLLMNNGIMWFDPEPGKPNSLAPDKACLMNICPTIGEKGGRRFAIGASGGRKILPAVLNLTSFLMDFDMSLEDAFHHPRIDNSGGGTIIADETLPPDVIKALGDVHPVVTSKRTVFPYAFACPAGVLRENGMNMGCTEIMSPWGDAVHEKEGA
ncbi:gamma-glutamyltransferase [Allomesorhizobium alhagi]|uniref:Gamma-glutamyltransferase n=1 Tax=Mesorhizobium alhagi CCNWXJ12-2 TaxID=1107882 RepID=H0I1W3_9HYPH|nr:gamma-glutamyltransferase [Mesorhizobium alhagi]EHK53008.1 gamma-glutamyltransferase [Mesorhizobium alhagi CCNWXJ12-2]